MEKADIRNRIDQFLVELQKRMDAYDTKQNYSANQNDQVAVEFGSRYARVIKSIGSSRSAYCFVDLTTGDLLKSAGWKAPAKGSRGNIFADDFGMSACERYTLVYFNRGRRSSRRFSM